MNEWDVICQLATGSVIRTIEDGASMSYELVKPSGAVPIHIVGKLADRGWLQGPNSYRLSDAGLLYYMQRVDGRAPDACAASPAALSDGATKCWHEVPHRWPCEQCDALGESEAGHHMFPQETPPIPEEPQSPTTTGGEKEHNGEQR